MNTQVRYLRERQADEMTRLHQSVSAAFNGKKAHKVYAETIKRLLE